MADVKWIKLAVDIFDNRKIRQIEKMPEGDALIVTWLKLLTLAGSTNDNGLIYLTREIPFTDQLLSTQFNMPLNIIQLALGTFQRFGMIEIIEDIIHISNWEKYQNIEGMDRIREQGRKRVAEYRARKKLEAITDGNVTCNVTVTKSNAIDIDKEEEVEKEEDKSTKRKRFTPPTLEEVQAYCKERKNNVDAKKFFDYYQEGEWHDSQGKPVRNWKQKLLRWEKDDTQRQTQKKKPMDERELHEEDYEHGYYSDIMNRPLRQTN